MPSHSNEQKVLLTAIAFVVGIAALITQIFHGDSILVDPFHYGEYFAAATAIFKDTSVKFHPLTIHGALDYLPAILTEATFGAENYFLPTFAVYKILSFIAAIYLALITYKLTKEKSNQFFLLLATFLAGPFLVGYRDLFLLISVHLFLYVLDAHSKGERKLLLHIIFGFMVGFGLFWSYDRGIAGAVSLGIPTIALLLTNRKPAIALATFGLTVIMMGLFFDFSSPRNYLADVLILLETSGKWSYGLKALPVFLTLFAVAFNFFMLYIMIKDRLKSEKFSNEFPLLIFFGLIGLFMLKIGVNRADLGHVHMSLWIPLLISFYLYEKSAFVTRKDIFYSYILLGLASVITLYFKSFAALIACGISAYALLNAQNTALLRYRNPFLAFLTIICLGLTSLIFMQSRSDGRYSWISTLLELPTNRSSSTAGVVWTADLLKMHSVDCVFDLANNGVINGLLRLPSCSRFTYPIYAGTQHEEILISDLSATAPDAIVYSSSYWSYNIDGSNMKTRFPNLDDFIIQEYKNEVCNHGYCVRYK